MLAWRPRNLAQVERRCGHGYDSGDGRAAQTLAVHGPRRSSITGATVGRWAAGQKMKRRQKLYQTVARRQHPQTV